MKSNFVEVNEMSKRRQLHCSFCGKKETEVLKLVAGPRVYICDRCVAIASQIMENDSSDDPERQQAAPTLWRKLLIRVRQLWRSRIAKRVIAYE